MRDIVFESYKVFREKLIFFPTVCPVTSFSIISSTLCLKYSVYNLPQILFFSRLSKNTLSSVSDISIISAASKNLIFRSLSYYLQTL